MYLLIILKIKGKGKHKHLCTLQTAIHNNQVQTLIYFEKRGCCSFMSYTVFVQIHKNVIQHLQNCALTKCNTF